MEYIRTPHQAEQNAAARMRELGFSDAVATTGGPDGGVDVRASGALAQVKWRGGVAGRPELQQLFGARGADFKRKLLYFSAAGYSQHAQDYARSASIALFTYDPTGTLTPENHQARNLVSEAKQVASSSSLPSTTSRVPAPSSTETSNQPIGCAPELILTIVGLVFSIGAVTGLQRLLSPEEGDSWSGGALGLFIFLLLVAIACWLGVSVAIRERLKKWKDK